MLFGFFMLFRVLQRIPSDFSVFSLVYFGSFFLLYIFVTGEELQNL